MITQSELKEILHYDPETGIFTWKERPSSMFNMDRICKSWNSRYSKTAAGTIQECYTGKKYIDIRIFSKHNYAHRLAYLYMIGEYPENQIDHINGNGLDNRWKNIRPVTAAENNKNMRLGVRNTSGVLGVTWCKAYDKWRVQIRANGVTTHVGYFDNIDDAISARKEADKLYGYHSNHGDNRPL